MKQKKMVGFELTHHEVEGLVRDYITKKITDLCKGDDGNDPYVQDRNQRLEEHVTSEMGHLDFDPETYKYYYAFDNDMDDFDSPVISVTRSSSPFERDEDDLGVYPARS